MKYFTRTLLKGLAALFPIALTLYFVYWLGISLERLLRAIIVFFLPQNFYWPGMGLIVGILLLFLSGLLVDAWVVRRLLRLGEVLLEKIPLVKSIYGALRDFMNYFSQMKENEQLQKVVSVSFGEYHLIGFLTGDPDDNDMPEETGLSELVSVYLPMSYQIGGFTVYVPRDHITGIDMSVEDAMRLVLTAGLSRGRKGNDVDGGQ